MMMNMGEHNLRMVPVIISKPKKMMEVEIKGWREKRIEERVKRLKSLRHGVHRVSSRSVFFPAAPITFIEQDLSLAYLPHYDPLIIKL